MATKICTATKKGIFYHDGKISPAYTIRVQDRFRRTIQKNHKIIKSMNKERKFLGMEFGFLKRLPYLCF